LLDGKDILLSRGASRT